jgi:hypothetical protein
MYITIVVGEIFSIVWADCHSFVAMFCMCVKISAVYSNDAGPEIGEPCGSPFSTGLILVHCPSRQIAACVLIGMILST